MGTDKRALWATFYATVAGDGEKVGPDDFHAALAAGLLAKDGGNIRATERGLRLMPDFIRAEATALEHRAMRWRAHADAMDSEPAA